MNRYKFMTPKEPVKMVLDGPPKKKKAVKKKKKNSLKKKWMRHPFVSGEGVVFGTKSERNYRVVRI